MEQLNRTSLSDGRLYQLFANSARSLSYPNKRKDELDFALEGIKNLKRKVMGFGILSSEKTLSIEELAAIFSNDLKIGKTPVESKDIIKMLCGRKLAYSNDSYLLIKETPDGRSYEVHDYGLDEGEEFIPSTD